MKYYIIISSFALILLLSSGCINNENEYAKGEIYVVFNENVTTNETYQIIESYNLTLLLLKGSPPFDGWVIVPEGKEKYYVDLLSENPRIEEVSLSYYD